MANDRPTSKDLIREFLANQRNVPKGRIEDFMRSQRYAYGETTARRLREMVEDGELVKGRLDDGRTTYTLASLARGEVA